MLPTLRTPRRIRSLDTTLQVLLLALGCVACGPESGPADDPAATPVSTKDARLAQDRARQAAAARRMEALDLHDRVVDSVRTLLDDGTEGTWRRSGGWAFRTFELGYWTDWVARDPETGRMRAEDFDAPEHPWRALHHYATELAEHGIDFLVVPVPLRTQVYPERLPNIDAPPADFGGIDLGHVAFLEKLAEEGVEVVDLLPPFCAARFGDPTVEDAFLYHAYDRHWTPRGVEIAARTLAERIRRFPWFADLAEPGSVREGRDYEVRREQRAWTPRRKPGMPESGDPVEIWLESILRPSDGSPARQPTRDSPILLLGDSFLKHFADEGGDVASQLYQELAMPLDTIALPGGGSVAVWQALARREDGLRGKRLVIWLSSIDQLADPRLERLELFED